MLVHIHMPSHAVPELALAVATGAVASYPGVVYEGDAAIVVYLRRLLN